MQTISLIYNLIIVSIIINLLIQTIKKRKKLKFIGYEYIDEVYMGLASGISMSSIFINGICFRNSYMNFVFELFYLIVVVIGFAIAIFQNSNANEIYSIYSNKINYDVSQRFYKLFNSLNLNKDFDDNYSIYFSSMNNLDVNKINTRVSLNSLISNIPIDNSDVKLVDVIVFNKELFYYIENQLETKYLIEFTEIKNNKDDDLLNILLIKLIKSYLNENYILEKELLELELKKQEKRNTLKTKWLLELKE